MERLIPLVQAMMPKTIVGWIIYTLTIVSTVFAVATYNIIQTDQFKEILLKHLDRKELEAKFCEESFLEESDDLIASTRAKIVIVWAVDLSGATANKNVMYAHSRIENSNKVTQSWIGRAAPIYSNDQARIDMTRLLESNVVCNEFEAISEIGRRIEKLGDIKWYCSAPVPPSSGNMIGVITAYFSEKPVVDSALILDMRKAAQGVTDE